MLPDEGGNAVYPEDNYPVFDSLHSVPTVLPDEGGNSVDSEDNHPVVDSLYSVPTVLPDEGGNAVDSEDNHPVFDSPNWCLRSVTRGTRGRCGIRRIIIRLSIHYISTFSHWYIHSTTIFKTPN